MITCPRCGSGMEATTCPQCGFDQTPAADNTPDEVKAPAEAVPDTEPRNVAGRLAELEQEIRTPPLVTKPPPRQRHPSRKRHPIRTLIVVALLGWGVWYGWPLVQGLLTAAPTSTTELYPTVTAPPGSQECAQHGSGPHDKVGTYNEITQCGLANNVWQAYQDAGLGGQDGVVVATSPESGETYEMQCTGSQPVLCSGGETARVVIYGGGFTVE